MESGFTKIGLDQLQALHLFQKPRIGSLFGRGRKQLALWLDRQLRLPEGLAAVDRPVKIQRPGHAERPHLALIQPRYALDQVFHAFVEAIRLTLGNDRLARLLSQAFNVFEPTDLLSPATSRQ